MITMTEFAKRRKQLMQTIGAGSAMILPSAPMALRNGDYDYPYRQHSDLYYVTGFEEPESVVVLLPKRKEGEFILFSRKRDRAQETWTGIRAGQEGARHTFKADQAFPIDDIEKILPELLEGCEHIHYALGRNLAFDTILIAALNKIRGKVRGGVEAPFALIDTSHTLHEMRLIKSPAEIALMRKAAEISTDAHLRAMQFCKPGVNEYQLEAEIVYECQRQGARFQAYNPIVGHGPNTCILHYDRNDQRITDGSLVLIDAGGEYQYYASDITRTFPANGHFTAEQKAIYDIVLEAQLAGIKTIRPGVAFSAVETITVKIITQGLVDVGLLKGNVNTLIEQKAYFPFYMHRCGHWIGLDVHDVGRYKPDGKWRILQPGMVRTVEPGIYISSDIPGVPKRWHNIGIRIEDDVVVTTQGCDILNNRLPKTTDEIENQMLS